MTTKFAIATNDAYQCVMETFLRAGWKLDKLFISADNWLYSNKQVIARGLELGAAIQHSPITDHDLVELGKNGCSVLIVSCYQWKIPPWQTHIPFALNFHPSPLPQGRGAYPQVRALLESRTSWGVTCHKIDESYDSGDILDSEPFPLDADECHETLRLKIEMASARLAERVAVSLAALWQAAVPQEGGSYWPKWTDQDRTIDFTLPIESVMRKIRAFGDLECIASVNNVMIFIHRAKGWHEQHLSQPGSVVHSSNLDLVVAVPDGYIAITEWGLHAPGSVTAHIRG